tara:strand:+ start:6893 stop:7150 length:258 start_codon:yes stop_codon:yes gene_type:complete
MVDLENRVTALENSIKDVHGWIAKQNTRIAVEAEQRKHVDERFDKIEKRLGGIEGHLGQLIKIVIFSVVGAFLTFALNGGLQIAN